MRNQSAKPLVWHLWSPAELDSPSLPRPHHVARSVMAVELRSAAPSLYASYNERCFSGQLPAHLRLCWSKRLITTAGRNLCFGGEGGGGRTCEIELNPRVLDTMEKLRHTLVHEMCHAAVWLGLTPILAHRDAQPDRSAHGPQWQAWASAAAAACPELSPLKPRHSYAIAYRHLYRCGQSAKSSNAACLKYYGSHSLLKVTALSRYRCGSCGSDGF